MNGTAISLLRRLVSATAAIAFGAAGSVAALPRLPGFVFVFAQTATDTPATAAAGTSTVRPPERTFVTQGLVNSRHQAELSRLAVTQAASTEVREFAQQLVTDYQQINTALETIARRKSIDVPLQPVSFSDRYRVLAEQSGASFDHAFIHEVADANARALRLCSAALSTVKDSDIRELAGSLLPVLRDHANKTSDLAKSL
jgi:putative membrane protein